MRVAPTGAIASLKHRTASSTLFGDCWEYTPTKGTDGPTIIARVVLAGAKPVDLEVPVCSSRKPRPHAWVLTRTGEESWRLSPARYGASAAEMTKPTPFDPALPTGSLDLVSAPPDVQRELEQLA